MATRTVRRCCVGLWIAVATVVLARGAHAQFAAVKIATLPFPVFVTSAPGDFKRIFLVDRLGTVRVLDTSAPPNAWAISPTVFLDITALVPSGLTANDERGLLSIAFHPQYQTNGKFYVFHSVANKSENDVAEYTVRDPSTLVPTPGAAVADPASRRVIMQIAKPQTNHNGGWLGFGPDGYLYISVGDGGGSNDADAGHNPTIGNAQDTGVPLGKILRIDVNVQTEPGQGPFFTGGIASYGIPANNLVLVAPTGATGSRHEIWARGLRNPWRASFDRTTGDLWIADVGQAAIEEINFQPALTLATAAEVAGRNYGWRCFEGVVSFNTNGGNCPASASAGGLTPPLAQYYHAAPPSNAAAITFTNVNGCAVTGGYVYRGCQIPELRGQYLFADYCAGHVFTTALTGGGTALTPAVDQSSQIWTAGGVGTPVLPAVPRPQVLSFGEDAYGEVYIVGATNVYKLVSTAPGVINLSNADDNRDGVVTVADIFSFLRAWFGQDMRADFDRSNTVEVSDIFAFLRAWFRLCAG